MTKKRFPPENAERIQRLKKARMAAGYRSARAARHAMGMSASALNAIEGGVQNPLREPHAEIAAKVFGVRKEWLWDLEGDMYAPGQGPVKLNILPPPAGDGATRDQGNVNRGNLQSLRPVPILGEVAGGVWVEVEYQSTISDGIEYLDVPVSISSAWPDGAVFALRVRGNSVNRQVQSGGHVVCLSTWAAHRGLLEGDWVVVERRRGSTVETTVKQARHSDAGWELWPDSTDPLFQKPIPLGTEDGEEVEVKGFVLNFVGPTLFR